MTCLKGVGEAMIFWSLVLRESADIRRSVIFAVVFSSLANATLLAIINAAATAPPGSGFHLRLLLLFIVALLLYIQCLRYSTRMMHRMMNTLVHNLRVRFVAKLARAELPALEGLGKSDVLNAITAESTFLADSGALIANAFQAVLVVLFATAYIAYLSWMAFAITVGCMVLSVLTIRSMSKSTSALHLRERSQEACQER